MTTRVDHDLQIDRGQNSRIVDDSTSIVVGWLAHVDNEHMKRVLEVEDSILLHSD